MSATLNLDEFELLWFCEGFMGKSHLRWSGYSRMIDDVWPQLNDDEREFVFTFLKRDTSWLWDKPYKKCRNDYCDARDRCMRYVNYEEGDETLENAPWKCHKCNMLL